MTKRDTSQYKITDPVEMLVRTQPPIDKHPGIFIKETLLPAYGLSVSEAARRLGVDRAGFHVTLSGKYDVSRDLAYKLGALMRDEVADFLIAYQTAYDKQREAEKREAYKKWIPRAEPVAADG